MKEAKYFYKIDLRLGILPIEDWSMNISKIIFRTKNCCYKILVMLVGWTDIPIIFKFDEQNLEGGSR